MFENAEQYNSSAVSAQLTLPRDPRDVVVGFEPVAALTMVMRMVARKVAAGDHATRGLGPVVESSPRSAWSVASRLTVRSHCSGAGRAGCRLPIHFQ